MVCTLTLLRWHLSNSFCLGIYQDFQKEGKNGKKDQAEQTYAKLDQIQD